MKKPLIKDMVVYFYDNENWKQIWLSRGEADLRIDVLKHTSITRLVHINVRDPYIGYHDEVITYSLDAKNLNPVRGMDTFLGQYLQKRPNQEEIKSAMKIQWKEDDE